MSATCKKIGQTRCFFFFSVFVITVYLIYFKMHFFQSYYCYKTTILLHWTINSTLLINNICQNHPKYKFWLKTFHHAFISSTLHIYYTLTYLRDCWYYCLFVFFVQSAELNWMWGKNIVWFFKKNSFEFNI